MNPYNNYNYFAVPVPVYYVPVPVPYYFPGMAPFPAPSSQPGMYCPMHQHLHRTDSFANREFVATPYEKPKNREYIIIDDDQPVENESLPSDYSNNNTNNAESSLGSLAEDDADHHLTSPTGPNVSEIVFHEDNLPTNNPQLLQDDAPVTEEPAPVAESLSWNNPLSISVPLAVFQNALIESDTETDVESDESLLPQASQISGDDVTHEAYDSSESSSEEDPQPKRHCTNPGRPIFAKLPLPPLNFSGRPAPSAAMGPAPMSAPTASSSSSSSSPVIAQSLPSNRTFDSAVCAVRILCDQLSNKLPPLNSFRLTEADRASLLQKEQNKTLVRILEVTNKYITLSIDKTYDHLIFAHHYRWHPLNIYDKSELSRLGKRRSGLFSARAPKILRKDRPFFKGPVKKGSSDTKRAFSLPTKFLTHPTHRFLANNYPDELLLKISDILSASLSEHNPDESLNETIKKIVGLHSHISHI